jgi:hypothetical protein
MRYSSVCQADGGITNFTEQGSHSKANSCSATHQIPLLLWTPNVDCRVHKIPSLAISWTSWIEFDHPTECFTKIYLNIILQSTPVFKIVSFSSGFQTNILYQFVPRVRSLILFYLFSPIITSSCDEYKLSLSSSSSSSSSYLWIRPCLVCSILLKSMWTNVWAPYVSSSFWITC